jgi:CHAT domain-containing protein/tetratricopeptide (TPR) repeat protein
MLSMLRLAKHVLITAMLAVIVALPARAQDGEDVAALNKQVDHLYDQGKYAEAAVFAERTLMLAERLLGSEHRDALQSVNNLAIIYQTQGRHSEAEPLYHRALDARQRILGMEHTDTLSSIANLASLYVAQARYGEAEPLYKLAVVGQERILGREHPNTLLSVANLAVLYRAQGRFSEAEPLLKRALEVRERVLGREHLLTLVSVNSLAALYDDQGRHSEAEQLYSRALEAQVRVLGRDHPDTLISANNLAGLYLFQGRHSEAEPLFKWGLEAFERTLGKEHPQTLLSANNLAFLYQTQGRYAQAESLYQRNLEAQQRVLGAEHPDTLVTVDNLATLYFERRDWPRAAQFWRVSTAAIIERTRRGMGDIGQALTGRQKNDAEQRSGQFLGLIKSAYRLAGEGRAPDAAIAREMFQIAQWALNSEAAQSLAQMAARGTKGDPGLAALARERQDLVADWEKRDALRNTSLGEATDKRNATVEAMNLARLAAIDARIAEIDGTLAVEFPNYTALVTPAPLSVEDVQSQLGADEVLLLFLDTAKFGWAPDETFIWVVSKTSMRWVRSDLGTAALTREVQALRCGLDATAWAGSRCADLVGHSRTGVLPPFDHVRAHNLYKALFGQIEDMAKGKHLLLVPSGALTQLPIQVLVTAPPQDGGHKSAAWLVRGHAITVLPAVSSLKALRRTSHPSAATKPMIGFGNPLLDGPDSSYHKLAQLARDKQKCPATIVHRVVELFELRGGVPALETHEGLANVSNIRVQAPLPETADELCAVARDVNADLDEMRLGARATEHEVKALSASGQLAQYRIVHFATHGAMAGEVKGSSQPGLILTPPQAASEDDDGYLSASEITGLKLDADWVILSACNTAAGNATKAEALSGLARAFIYAQARTLLVSHWAVDSDATVKLVTAAIGEMSRDRNIGRSEALRRAALALIDKGTPHEAHPAYWAPFVVVGEGTR